MAALPPTFPLNAWYAAAWDVEVKRELLPRTICNQKLVLYRKPDGHGRRAGRRLLAPAAAAVAWAGSTATTCLRLPRAGLQRAAAAAPTCRAQETHQSVGLRARLPGGGEAPLRLGLARRSGAGRPGAGARPALERRPGLGRRRQDDPRASATTGWCVDNLMDLTHETFVHGSSIGNDAVAEAPFVATHGDRTATVTRWMQDIDAPPFWAAQLRQATGKVDRWQIIRFEAPCTDRHRRRRGAWPAPARRRATGDAQGRQRLRAQHHHARDRQDLPLFLGLRPQLPPRASSASRTSCARAWPRIFREDEVVARGAAARHRRASGPRLLQPQHRRRRDVGAPADRPDDRAPRREPPPDRRAGGGSDAMAAGDPAAAMSQTVHALLRAARADPGRRARPGERMSELAIAERLGVSRTPVRAALMRLEQEGLLERCPSAASR